MHFFIWQNQISRKGPNFSFASKSSILFLRQSLSELAKSLRKRWFCLRGSTKLSKGLWRESRVLEQSQPLKKKEFSVSASSLSPAIILQPNAPPGLGNLSTQLYVLLEKLFEILGDFPFLEWGEGTGSFLCWVFNLKLCFGKIVSLRTNLY